MDERWNPDGEFPGADRAIRNQIYLLMFTELFTSPVKCHRPRKSAVRAWVHLATCWFAAATLSSAQQLPRPHNETESPSLAVQGDTATFSTSQMIVVVSKGQVTRIFNRLTATEYISAGMASKSA